MKGRIGQWVVVVMLLATVGGCHRRGTGVAEAAPAYPESGAYGAHWPTYGTHPWPYGAYHPSRPPAGHGPTVPPRPPPGQPRPGAQAGAQAAAYAQSVQGRPYCWGGTGPECFDCSGLTYAAWRAAGKTIPRTSDEQREQLAPVAMAALLPGDILWRPGHVGIYVGNGWVVHAPRKGQTVRFQAAQAYREAFRP